MSIKEDTQELVQEIFICDLDGISENLTYHSMDTSQVYDPETGEFTGVAAGDGGGPLFNDADNSHWLGIV